ncbi:hypothetical protein EVAR_9582_1 [Eumeta japonica]|uniref:Uncharacterized protein n=1 Tax=Eumeta variegata TaxID=151549 RepID=A0A4C1TMR9_EUMVA|nr:hypothetical protein EVAR_9582_1 [Eumeta japonica]
MSKAVFQCRNKIKIPRQGSLDAFALVKIKADLAHFAGILVEAKRQINLTVAVFFGCTVRDHSLSGIIMKTTHYNFQMGKFNNAKLFRDLREFAAKACSHAPTQ